MLAITKLPKIVASTSKRLICNVTFKLPNGEKKTVQGKEGESVLQVAHRNEIPLEGACEGSLGCATCHILLDQKTYDKLPEPSEAEEDLLDSVPGLTETSRLGCQVIIPNDMDNLEITLPMHSKNFYVDGHVPKPH